MKDYSHTFHIPVMGIGHSVDTPIRVAHLGITSVISLVDDILLKKIRKYYTEKYGLPYLKISKNEEDGRAKRITAYLETVREIVRIKMEDLREEPFFEVNNKRKYFDLLSEEIPLKTVYNKLLKMEAGPERNALAEDLTCRMQPGSIDVNIMVKLDCIDVDNNGNPLAIPFSNVQKTGSEIWTRDMVTKGKPGSPCSKRFLVFNTEFTERPICLASRQYQNMKLEEIKNMEVSEGEKDRP